MSGYTKHVYEEDLQETKKQLVKYVDDIIPLLSEEYDFDEILKLVKKYYPFEWRMLEEKYQYYCKKDKTIEKFHGKKRYNADSPEIILRKLSSINRLLMPDTIKRRQETFSIQKQKEYKNLCNKKESLENLKKKKISDLDEVINKINEMREVINNSSDEDSENVYNNKSESELNESDAEILWILEEDRQRISRDIHDTVVQNLTALIHKEEFINQILDKDVNRAKIEINNAKLLIKDSVKDLRNIIYQLRPMELDDLGFNEALLNLIDKLDDSYKNIMIHTTIDCSDDISQIASISSLRIINELSSNSYKYADCSNIYIDISTDEQYIYIDYRDDGCGFDYNSIGKVKNNNSGYGIRMLNERIVLLKGSIEYDRDRAEFKIKIPIY